MSRFLALGLLAGAGALAFAGSRGAFVPGMAPIAETIVVDDPVTGEPVAVDVAPAPAQAGRLSPRDVLALLPSADPEGWAPAADVLAFVEVESAFRPNAYRFERHLNEASYGLMQVLESTARDMGLSGPAESMFDPLTSLTIGVRALRWKYDFLRGRLAREPTTTEWVGAYNGGVGAVLRGRVPLSYVRKWEIARGRYA